MNWNGAIYTYVHNYQGDIIAILDSAGSAVVEYYYDAWGRQYSASGTMADTLGKLNPFRYRGYVYDEETGLYYLRSRYYNPEWGRFINADTVLGKVCAVGSHNLFAYCENKPVVAADPDGQIAKCVSDIANAAAEWFARTIINAICGFEHASKIGDFSVSRPNTNITITKDEADSHNSAVSDFVGTVSFMFGAILGSASGGTSILLKKIGESFLYGFITDKVTGAIQDFFVDAFTVRAGTYTSIIFKYERTFKYLFFFTGIEQRSYELRIYPDYCEVWYSYLYSGFSSTITAPQKVGEMTLFELQEVLGG